MSSSLLPLAVTTAARSGAEAAADTALLTACESVFRQTAASWLPAGTDAYVSQLKAVLSSEPVYLIVAQQQEDANKVVGLCIVRTYNNTFNVVKVQVESIVVDAAVRSRGVGRALMAEARALGLFLGAKDLVASVGTQAFDATRFFMRERFVIESMGFNAPTSAKRPAGASPAPIDVAASASASASSSPPATASPSPSAVFDSWSLLDVSQPTVSAFDLALLRAAEGVVRQLRQTYAQIAEGSDAYVARMQRIAKDGGRMVIVTARPQAAVADASSADASAAPAAPVVLGVGVYRFYVDSSTGLQKCWVDDLVTDSTKRSLGVGALLVDSIRAECRARGVATLQLDSGVQRHQAHKFYFANRFVIDEYTFETKLTAAK